MRFLLDNSLSPRMVEHLVAAGHDAVHVRDLGLAEADDTKIFTTAATEHRTLVAQDADFAMILAIGQSTRPSLFLFRCRSKSPDALSAMLLANLATLQADLDRGAIATFDDARIRVRSLPIGGASVDAPA